MFFCCLIFFVGGCIYVSLVFENPPNTLVRRCFLEDIKAEPQEVFRGPNIFLGGVWMSRVYIYTYLYVKYLFVLREPWTTENDRFSPNKSRGCWKQNRCLQHFLKIQPNKRWEVVTCITSCFTLFHQFCLGTSPVFFNRKSRWWIWKMCFVMCYSHLLGACAEKTIGWMNRPRFFFRRAGGLKGTKGEQCTTTSQEIHI